MKESEVRNIVREELLRERSGSERIPLEDLEEKHDGQLINNPRVVSNTADMLVRDGVLDEREAKNYKAFYWAGDPLIGGVGEGTKVWASYKEPHGSMTPTERVKFHRIH